MHIFDMNIDQLHREIARLSQREADLELSLLEVSRDIEENRDRLEAAMDALDALREEQPFGPDYFEGNAGRHDPDLLDTHPMGDAVRLGPSNY